jgi:hypothetical protein
MGGRVDEEMEEGATRWRQRHQEDGSMKKKQAAESERRRRRETEEEKLTSRISLLLDRQHADFMAFPLPSQKEPAGSISGFWCPDLTDSTHKHGWGK